MSRIQTKASQAYIGQDGKRVNASCRFAVIDGWRVCTVCNVRIEPVAQTALTATQRFLRGAR